jgi:hypothetical protein
LEVHAPGYQPVRLEKVSVGPGSSVEASLRRVQSSGAVSGVVWGPTGDPVAGVSVSLRRADTAAGRALRTGPDGRVRFEVVPAGRYIASADFGFALLRKWNKQKVLQHYACRGSRAFEVQEGQESLVELGFILGGSSATIRAREGERPLEGVEVRLFLSEPPNLEQWNPWLITGSDGAVTFDRLRPGRYRASLKKGHGAWRFEPLEIKEAESIDRSLDLGRARIRGRLLLGGHGAAGEVAVTGPGGRSAAVRAAVDGAFEFPWAIPGRYRLEALGGPPVEVEVPPTGDPTPVEIRINEAVRE